MEDNQIYVRCYSFGEKQEYDENQMISLKELMIWSFVGKDNKTIEKKMKYTTDEEKRAFSLKGIISRGKELMKKEYSTYNGNDLVEGIEITQEENQTHIHLYRPFGLTSKIGFFK